jgi:hypothetical protein
MTSYPGPTKTLSTNYTVEGTQFAIADEDDDALEPEDIWRQARAKEEHTHDDQRGLPVRRVETASAPQAPGHVQILGDNLRWWAQAVGEVRTALAREGDAVLDGTIRFNLPLLLAAQLVTPPAPGTNLSYLYAKPDGRLYIRSGSNPEAGVGSPPSWNLIGKGWETDQVPGANPELVRLALTSPTWALAYDAAATEVAYSSFRVPATYVPGLALPLMVTWTGATPGGSAKWRLSFARYGPGDQLTGAFQVSTDLTSAWVGAGAWAYQEIAGSITVPGLQPSDRLNVALARVGPDDDLAGDGYVLDASVTFP